MTRDDDRRRWERLRLLQIAYGLAGLGLLAAGLVVALLLHSWLGAAIAAVMLAALALMTASAIVEEWPFE